MTFNEWVTVFSISGSILIGSIIWSAWAVSYLKDQFSATRHLIDTKIEQLEKAIVDKLEYHERHDDDRFSEMRKNSDNRFHEVSNDIWDIRVRNAAKDGSSIVRKRND